MPTDLWAGVELKIENAQFFLDGMARSLSGPEGTQMNAAIQATGTIIDTGWQRSFYAQLDAFLAMVRSVPEIIKCCFGVDKSRAVATWSNGLPSEEKDRRQKFADEFGPLHEEFRELPL